MKHSDPERKKAIEPIVVSKSAYKDLVLLKKFLDQSGEEFGRFPETDSKNASIQELFRQKNVLKKQGERMQATYGLAVPFEQVVESARKTKELNKTPKAAKQASVDDVTTFRKVPTVGLLYELLGAITEEQKGLSQERYDALTKQIKSLTKQIGSMDGDEEAKAIENLSRLQYERKNIKATLTIEAIKNVTAEARFKGYDWTHIVSHSPGDYGSE